MPVSDPGAGSSKHKDALVENDKNPAIE
jgi:hypothetical protein